MRLHLKMLGSDLGELFAPESHDFRWNKDYTAFWPVRCRWADDASYAAYQGSDLDD